jgi:hypothetical protein
MEPALDAEGILSNHMTHDESRDKSQNKGEPNNPAKPRRKKS